MKRFLVFFVALSFLFCGTVFAVEKPAAGPAKAEPAAAAPAAAKETKMSATGKVMEISDTMLKIERTVKGKVETMEFTIEKPCAKIAAGDKVKVSYVTRDDKNVALKVTKVKKPAKKVKKATKKGAAKEEKPAEEAAPADK